MMQGGTMGQGGMLIRPHLSVRPAWLPTRTRVEVDRMCLDWDNPQLPILIQRADRRLLQSSASALKSLDRCATKFWLGDVVGLRTESSSDAQDGTVIHNGHETWRQHGTPWPHTSVTLAVSRGFLPRLEDGAGWGLEVEFWVPVLVGTETTILHGFLDLLHLRGNRARIKDLKTKRTEHAINKYGLSSTALLKDLQIRVYVWAVFSFCPQVEVVEASHVYLGREEPAADERTCTFTRALHEVRILGELKVEMERVLRLTRQHVNMDSVPRNPSACWDFGGCEFLRVCHREDDDAGIEHPAADADGFIGQDVAAALAASLSPGGSMPSPLSSLPFPSINPPDGYPLGTDPPPAPTKKERAMNFTSAIQAAAGAAGAMSPPPGPQGAPPQGAPQAMQAQAPQQWAPPQGAPPPPQQQVWSTTAGAPVQPQGAHPGFSNPNPAHLQVAPPPPPAPAPQQFATATAVNAPPGPPSPLLDPRAIDPARAVLTPIPQDATAQVLNAVAGAGPDAVVVLTGAHARAFLSLFHRG